MQKPVARTCLISTQRSSASFFKRDTPDHYMDRHFQNFIQITISFLAVARSQREHSVEISTTKISTRSHHDHQDRRVNCKDHVKQRSETGRIDPRTIVVVLNGRDFDTCEWTVDLKMSRNEIGISCFVPASWLIFSDLLSYFSCAVQL